MSAVFGHKTLCLVTGASRGIGESIAKSFAPKFAAESVIILLARNVEHLKRVEHDIASKHPTLAVHSISCDLGKTNEDDIRTALEQFQKERYEVTIIVHNAATLGDISTKLVAMTQAGPVQDYYTTNVVSCLILNNIFLQLFPAELQVVVNISSGAAHASKNGLHLYGSAKAARDALFRGIADEIPKLRVLTYAPGPVITDMQTYVAENVYDDSIRAWSVDGVKNGTFLTANKCVEPLVKLLEENKFKSGEYVDVQNRRAKLVVS